MTRIYSSKPWRNLRDAVLSENPLCVHCKEQGRVTAAQEVDHIEPITHGGDPWDWDNLQPLCKSCHSRKTLNEKRHGNTYVGGCGPDGWPTDPRHPANGGDGNLSREYRERVRPPDLKPSRIPLEIVCGPPGGGKSTYVRDRAGKDDLVIDLDAIMSSLSGLPEHMTSRKHLRPALERRNALLRGLSTDTIHGKAYFIVSAPDPAERRWWQDRLGGTVVVIAPPPHECHARIRIDPARHGLTDRMCEKATAWWKVNQHLSTIHPQDMHKRA